jgi:hypothetical protein
MFRFSQFMCHCLQFIFVSLCFYRYSTYTLHRIVFDMSQQDRYFAFAAATQSARISRRHFPFSFFSSFSFPLLGASSTSSTSRTGSGSGERKCESEQSEGVAEHARRWTSDDVAEAYDTIVL